MFKKKKNLDSEFRLSFSPSFSLAIRTRGGVNSQNIIFKKRLKLVFIEYTHLHQWY